MAPPSDEWEYVRNIANWAPGRVWDPIPVPDRLGSRIGDPGLDTYDLGSIRSGLVTSVALGEYLTAY